MGSFKSKFILLILLTISLVAFQNCLSDSSDSRTENSSLHANGDGYGGKLGTYVNYDKSSKCSTDSVNVESAIEVSSKGVFQTVKDCEDITPVEVSSLSVAEHNDDFGIEDQETELYEYYEDDALETAEILCRGERFNAVENQREVSDFVIMTDERRYYANIRAGVYVDGVLTQSRSSQRVEVFPRQEQNRTLYEGSDPLTGDNFTLVVFEDTLKGTLLSSNRTNATITNPNQQFTQEELYTDHDVLILQDLNCIRHD